MAQHLLHAVQALYDFARFCKCHDKLALGKRADIVINGPSDYQYTPKLLPCMTHSPFFQLSNRLAVGSFA